MTLAASLRTYRLTNARVVALLEEGGGAVVETRDVEYMEGRSLSISGREGDIIHLVSIWSFSVADSKVPDMVEMSRAQIVIEGDCDGQRVELRGAGSFGYTDLGTFEGEFRAAPTFLLEEEPDEPPSDELRKSDLTPEEWVEHMRTVEVDAPEQFRRAQYGVGLQDRDADEGDD